MFRVLEEETFGMLHNQQLDFGTVGDWLYIGSIYTTPGGGPSTVVLMPASYMPDATVTLAVTGTAGPLTVVDCQGVTSTVTINGGLAVIPVAELTYVQLPTGATVSVYTINGWGAGAQTNVAPTATGYIGGVGTALLNDGLFQTNYVGGESSQGIVYSSASLPDTAELVWGSPVSINRVVVWCVPPWQDGSSLAAFQVQTSTNGGSSWTTQATVTKTNVTSFQFGTSSSNVGCQHETYWDEQWIFDVPFPLTLCNAVRIYVTQTSYGGEPDALAISGPGGSGGGKGQGNTVQQLVLQEFAAMNTGGLVYVMPPKGRRAVVT
jgi:hypothetical protein